MFELDGQPLSLEELQGFAKDNNIDFGAYMTNMKNAGMVEKQIDSPSPIVESSTVSQSVDGGLDLPEISSEFLGAEKKTEITDILKKHV